MSKLLAYTYVYMFIYMPLHIYIVYYTTIYLTYTAPRRVHNIRVLFDLDPIFLRGKQIKLQEERETRDGPLRHHYRLSFIPSIIIWSRSFHISGKTAQKITERPARTIYAHWYEWLAQHNTN